MFGHGQLRARFVAVCGIGMVCTILGHAVEGLNAVNSREDGAHKHTFAKDQKLPSTGFLMWTMVSDAQGKGGPRSREQHGMEVGPAARDGNGWRCTKSHQCNVLMCIPIMWQLEELKINEGVPLQMNQTHELGGRWEAPHNSNRVIVRLSPRKWFVCRLWQNRNVAPSSSQ